MKYSCEVIRDLLPLYLDDVASPASRQMVEEHLEECTGCQSVLSRLQNDETENAITDEKGAVIAGQRRFFERRSAVVGSVIAGIFMIPVFVCLVVNLSVGAGLDWFFIVLSALLVAASLSVVPLMVPERKGWWTLGSFTASLLLLFGVCCLYTGGRWFFTASASVLFGISLILLPFVVRRRVLQNCPAVPPEAPDAGFARKAGKPRRRLQIWEIVLLVLGSPLWLSLLIAAFAVLLSGFVVIWAVILSLWAVDASLAAGAFGSAVTGIWSVCRGGGLQGAVLLCAASVLAGLAILLFFGCKTATRGAAALTKTIALWVKSLFEREENAI